MPRPRTPSPEQLRILLARAQHDGLDPSVIERLSVILHFAEHPASISETCRHFGISRSTFHRWIDRFDPEDVSSLADKSHEPLTLRQPAIDTKTIELIRMYRMRYTQMGKERIAELLQLDHDITVSPSSVGRIIERECLYFADTPFHWKKRLDHEQCIEKTSDAIVTDYQRATSDTPVVHIAVRSGPRMTMNWNALRRLFIVSSVIANISLISLLLGSALLQSFSTPARQGVQTETLHAAPDLHPHS